MPNKLRATQPKIIIPTRGGNGNFLQTGFVEHPCLQSLERGQEIPPERLKRSAPMMEKKATRMRHASERMNVAFGSTVAAPPPDMMTFIIIDSLSKFTENIHDSGFKEVWKNLLVLKMKF